MAPVSEDEFSSQFWYCLPDVKHKSTLAICMVGSLRNIAAIVESDLQPCKCKFCFQTSVSALQLSSFYREWLAYL